MRHLLQSSSRPMHILCVVGTRPEAIKMAPVIQALKRAPWTRTRLLVTGQHRALVDDALDFFGLQADVDLDLKRGHSNLNVLVAQIIGRLDEALIAERPDLVLAQGDTSSVLATALACFHRKLSFGHVEAGLRSGNLAHPFPEEGNRRLTSRLASLHFAPTQGAVANLLQEGIAREQIHLTGNPVIDALLATARRGLKEELALPPGRPMVLVTAHRRESHGAPMQEICDAIRLLARRYPEVIFLWPLHPNPAVREAVENAGLRRPNVHLIEPLTYGPFVAAMARATLVLTDSGGIQEEAPALGKPVLVLRETTERPEAIEAGVAELVGTQADRIVARVSRLLDDPIAYARMSNQVSPYGDGRAAVRIVEAVRRHHTQRSEPAESLAPSQTHLGPRETIALYSP